MENAFNDYRLDNPFLLSQALLVSLRVSLSVKTSLLSFSAIQLLKKRTHSQHFICVFCSVVLTVCNERTMLFRHNSNIYIYADRRAESAPVMCIDVRADSPHCADARTCISVSVHVLSVLELFQAIKLTN